MNANRTPTHERIRLTGTPVGRMVRITDFGDEIDPLQREQLHAYGLSAAQLARANVRYCLQAYAAAVVWLAVIGSVLGVKLLPALS